MTDAGREGRDRGRGRADARRVPLDDYRVMFERNPHPMWVYDLDTLRFIAVNDAAVAHYGYSREEFLGMTIKDIRPAEDLDALAENLVSYEHGVRGLEAAGSWRHVRKDGSLIEVEITSHELPFAGRPGKVVLAHDVTERRRAERAQAGQLAVATGLSGSATVEEAGTTVLAALIGTWGGTAGVVWLVDRERGALRCSTVWTQPRAPSACRRLEPALRSVTIAPGVGLPGEAWDRARPAYADIGSRGDSSPRSIALRGAEVRGVVALPVLSGAEVLGVVELYSTTAHEPDAVTLSALSVSAAQFGQFIARTRAEQQLAFQSLHDPLTGLPNRIVLHDRLRLALAHTERRQTSLAVLFLDVDQFKVINDSLGHHAGDELLCTLATRLRAVLRPDDTVARFGGDEFVIVAEIECDRDAVTIAERIGAVVTRPFALERGEHFATASIGIAVTRGTGRAAEELIRDADAAMYRAKERGRGRYEIFDELMRARTVARLRTENELRQALDRGQLRVFYQPIVALPDGTIVGVEALVRWQHPERGLILPGEFVAIAEESGLIVPIGEWVLAEACRHAAAWQRAHPGRAPISVAVNVSPVQIERGALMDAVERAARASGLAPRSLRLEITESALLRGGQSVAETLPRLRDRGIQLVLDDFGTGYSALGYLTRFRIDGLKIDRSFVAGLGDDREHEGIVKAVVDMAAALAIGVAAEGVESRQQADALHELGCHVAQGFYFAHPAPAEEIDALLSAAVGDAALPRRAIP